MEETERANFRRVLTELFSGYRAEWLKGEVFELFSEPSYFPQLTTSHPCFLVGGRGTGKTTALRCLSYQGQEAYRGSGVRESSEWPYFGMYYRVNTNRVRAFSGSELPEATWTKLFAHYINLEFCELTFKFLEWYGARYPKAQRLSESALESVTVALNLGVAKSQTEFGRELELARLRFEAAINNIADAERLPDLSMQSVPVDTLLREVKKLPQFVEKSFFFLVDEYENLDRPQQRVLNTLIKHCGELYSFKVGVKELGLRERSTLNSSEQLVHPADYKLINITDELQGRFPEFAAEVCGRRFQRALGANDHRIDLPMLLPELLPEHEAELLNVGAVVSPMRSSLLADTQIPTDVTDWLRQLSDLELFAIVCRASAEEKSVEAMLSESCRDQRKWREHYDNYKHAYLFAIRKGKRGIRKYYAGWRVFCLMSACNIRYLLELVDQAINSHLDSEGDPLEPINPQIQTEAAHAAGQKNLRELEGLSLGGAKLTRLLLGLGRVFQVMAENPVGHTPEVNQFHLSSSTDDPSLRIKVEEILREGIMHLALLRYPGSKLQEPSDIRQSDYSVHPIFSAFFGFSHRRKRKIPLSDEDILGIVDDPSAVIRTILDRQNRSAEEALPEQMQLFADFYALPY